MFAKLFETEEHGQILVKIDTGDDGPEVRSFFVPEGYGVCSFAAGFKDSDAGWKAAENIFEGWDMEQAIASVSATKEELGI